MTGLDPTTDTILSVSCVVTDAHLRPLDPAGFDAVIHHSPAALAAMSPWCVRVHGASGLTAQCAASSTSADAAAAALLTYVVALVPAPRTALLAGNSVHADKAFLARPPWTGLLEHLHYRIFDVSSTKEMVRRWCGEEVLQRAPVKALAHTAHDDVRESIAEAGYYMRLLQSVRVVDQQQEEGETREREGS